MKYDILLKKHHLKVTPQRVAILHNMHTFGHINVDELFLHVKQQFNSISLATLYKNINSMLDKSLIKEVKLPHTKSKYEITKAPHAHLLCTECNNFEDIFVETSALVQSIETDKHFQVKESALLFSGICTKCRA